MLNADSKTERTAFAGFLSINILTVLTNALRYTIAFEISRAHILTVDQCLNETLNDIAETINGISADSAFFSKQWSVLV